MRAEIAGKAAPSAVGPGMGRWFRAEPPVDTPAHPRSSSPASPPAGQRHDPPDSQLADTVLGAAAGSDPGGFEDWPRPESSAEQAVGRSLFRIFRTYVGARAVVGVLLALLHVGSAVAGTLPPLLALVVSGVYAVQGLVVAAWLLGRGRMVPRGLPGGVRIALTVGVDVLTFVVLLAVESGASFNFGALLVLPVLMAGVVMPRRQALATAAAVTLALLAQAWWSSITVPAGASPWLASGLAGIGLFAIAWVSGELAARLLREERSALDSQARARQQSRLNRLVIEEMGEGVLVLNRQGLVLAANPAAQGLLDLPLAGSGLEAWTTLGVKWASLLDAVERAHAEGDWPAAGREVVPAGGLESPVKLRVRIRFTRSDSARSLESFKQADRSALGTEVQDLCVLLLEDERAVQARVQQEKLAAMGRVSAGIAHEIRNPLAAIAQANELLAEDGLAAPQDRLVAIIADNVQRLRRLVDDVLEALPGAPVDARPVELVTVIRSVVADWARTARVPPAVLRLDVPQQGVQVLFDPEHLRRVLVNLLENAVRHSSAQAGAVCIALSAGATDEAQLTVSNDGPPVPPEVEIHMFEPFFSTRSRGSGLGLYLCKELCERHGAGIRLVRRAAQEPHRTSFVIRLRRPLARAAVAASAAPGPLGPGQAPV